MNILGLDIGGTKTALVAGDDTGRVYQRMQFPTCPERGFHAFFEDLCTQISGFVSSVNDSWWHMDEVSVSIGGPLDIEQGILYSPPNLPGWDTAPLKKLLENHFHIPCHIEHDGNAGALAEWYFGAARGSNHVIFLTMGTGFGAGIILNGQLYRGSTDLAGEVGHIRLAETGPHAYGKSGSWEAFCSGAGIIRLAAHRFPERWPVGSIDLPELAGLARGGDVEAKAVFQEAGQRLGQGLALLLDLLNPEVIVIGSLSFRLGDLVMVPALQQMRAEALPRAVEACRVIPAALGERLGDVAALCAAIAANRRPVQIQANTSSPGHP